MEQTRTYAHGVQHTRPIHASGRHIGDAANEPVSLADDFRAMCAELDAKRGRVPHEVVKREPSAKPAPMAPAYISTAYPTCSLCGSESHRDGACYRGPTL